MPSPTNPNGYPAATDIEGNLTVKDPSHVGQYGNITADGTITASAFVGVVGGGPTGVTNVPASLDPTGAADSLAIANALAALPATGGVIQLLPGIIINKPIVIQQNGVTLRGIAGPEAPSGDAAGKGFGTTIKVAAGFTNPSFGAFATGAILVMDQSPGVAGNPTFGINIRDLWIDLSSAPASVDGIATFGAIQSLAIVNVGVNKATGHAVNFVSDNASSSGSPYPDGVYLSNLILQAATGNGINSAVTAGKASDVVAYSVHAQNCGGDGFFINWGNANLVNCRADHCTNGYTIDSPPGGSGVMDSTTLIGCSTEDNSQNGLNLINNSGAGNQYLRWVQVDSCKFSGDGVNGGSGGGGFAGILVSGQQIVTIVNTETVCRTDKVVGGCPQYGVATAASGTGPGKPLAVLVDSCLLNYATAAINEAAGIGSAMIVTSHTLTAAGFEPVGINRYANEIGLFGSALVSGSYAADGAAITIANSNSSGHVPTLLSAAAASDGVLGIEVSGDTNARLNIDSNGRHNWGPGTGATDVFLRRPSANKLAVGTGDFDISTAGRGLQVAEGSNAKQGTATLTAGSVVVANTSVTATSRIFLTSQADGGTQGFLRVSARTAGTSFTITSSSGTDTSTVAYEIFEVG